MVNSMLRGSYTRAGFLDLSYQPATPSQRHETETSAHFMLCQTATNGNCRVGTRTRYLLGPRTLCNEASNGVGRAEHHDGSSRYVQNPTMIQLDCRSDRSVMHALSDAHPSLMAQCGRVTHNSSDPPGSCRRRPISSRVNS